VLLFPINPADVSQKRRPGCNLTGI
jgi:hypothetical protein